jgi:hypothetical protein
MSWTADKTGWLTLLGGAIAGYFAVKMSDKRGPRLNPGDIQIDLEGYTVFGRTTDPKNYSMDLYVVCHPDSDAVEHIGHVKRFLKRKFYKAYPVGKYRCLGMDSAVPDVMLKDLINKGMQFKSLRASARYLLDLYLRHKKFGIEVESIHRQHVKRLFV